MRLSTSDKALFFRQLAIMLKASIPLVTAFASLKTQFVHGKLNRLLGVMQSNILQGKSLQQAMSNFPQDFSPFILGMVDAGEKGGDLPQIFDKLAQVEEDRKEFQGKLSAELAYPLLVLLLSVFILPLPLLFSPGKGADLYVHSLIGALIPLAILILILILGHHYLMPNQTFAYAWQTFWIHVPLVGGLIKEQSLMVFFQTFGYLYSAGVSNLEAFRLASAAQSNWWLKGQLDRALPAIKQGTSFSDSLKPISGLLPATARSLLIAGEASGNLPEMMLKCAQLLQLDIETKSKILFKLASVLIFIGIGAFVGIKVIGYYQNLFKTIFSL